MQSSTVMIDGREIECEWEGDEGGGNGRDEPRTYPSISIVKATENGDPVELTQYEQNDAVRQIWAELERNAYLDRD